MVEQVNSRKLAKDSRWPIFVIGLEDAVDRRSQLESRLGLLGLSFTLIPAIDGRGGLQLEHEGLIDRDLAEQNLGRPMTDTEFGCALSHIKVYEEILRTDVAGAIILEDDAIVHELFNEFFALKAYESFDFIQLDFGRARIWQFGAGRKKLTDNIHVERLLFNAPLATGYSVSRSAARFLLANALPVSLPADWPCSLSPLKPRATFPRIVGHPPRHAANSHLAQDRDNARALLTRTGKSRPPGWFSRKVAPRARNPIPKSFRYFTRIFSVQVRRDDNT